MVVIMVVVIVMVTVNTTTIVLRPIMRILRVSSPTPIAGHIGDATTHWPTVRKNFRFTRMMQPGKIAWGGANDFCEPNVE